MSTNEEKQIMDMINRMLRVQGMGAGYYVDLNNLKRNIGTLIGHYNDALAQLENIGRLWSNYD